MLLKYWVILSLQVHLVSKIIICSAFFSWSGKLPLYRRLSDVSFTCILNHKHLIDVYLTSKWKRRHIADEQTLSKNTSCRCKCRRQIDVSKMYLCYHQVCCSLSWITSWIPGHNNIFSVKSALYNWIIIYCCLYKSVYFFHRVIKILNFT